jgi:tRNA threonylcarbamoyladenosine biosynthesis protein TsaE
MEILSQSLKDTENFAEDFLKNLKPFSNEATVIALSGNLGSGKTTFTQFFAKHLGITKNITSPTFVIIKTYNLQLETYNKLFHIDSYRLKSGEELKKLGWQEIISNPQNLILIEWPENVSDVIPQNAIKISFEFIDETTRKINLISK